MRGIILAAGEGARLGDTVPPFHKPLIVVNGRTLVGAAAGALQSLVTSVTVVVSPANASAICHVTNGYVDQYIVQPEPIGPGDALRRALVTMPGETAIVLMGDNTVTPHDIVAVRDHDGVNTIGGQRMGYPEALRFTRYFSDKNEWYEGPQRDDEHYTRVSSTFVWLGPVKINVDQFMAAWRDARTLKIGPAFNHMTHRPVPVPVQCEDIGVPEVLP